MPTLHRPRLESEANALVDSRTIDGKKPFRRLQFCNEGCYESWQADRRAGLIYGQARVQFDDGDEANVGWGTAARANRQCPYDRTDIDIPQVRQYLQEALAEAQAATFESEEERDENDWYIRSIEVRLADLDEAEKGDADAAVHAED